MAQIIFSLSELQEFLKSNLWMPEQIENLKGEGNEVLFKHRTLFNVPLSISLEFIEYKNGVAIFLVTIHWIPEILSKKRFNSLLKEKAFEEFIDLKEYPKVAIDINKILADRVPVNGLQIRDITLNDGLFTITT